MDKQSILGFILIGLVLTVWMIYTSPQKQPPVTTPETTEMQHTDTASTPQIKKERIVPKRETNTQSNTSAASDRFGKFFSGKETGKERLITIETEKYTAVISTKGGVIKKWYLKDYDTWAKDPVQLINDSTGGDFSLLFTTTDGKLINTKEMFFATPSNGFSGKTLSGNDRYTLELVLQTTAGTITKKLTFTNGLYDFDADIELVNMNDVIANFEYQIVWENSIRYTEANSVDESNSAHAYAFAGGELTSVDAASFDETPVLNMSGVTDWVSLRNKYFTVAMVSKDKKTTGAYLEGKRAHAPNQGAVETYAIALKVPFKNTDNEITSVSTFIGPLDFNVISEYNPTLEKTMSLGWSWFRPLSVYIFIPLFNFLHSFIPNYGIVLIIFSIIIKLALHPLTKSSMGSMRKMQKLRPLMEEIKEKYKSDPQTINMKTMELYRDYGVNPAGGCLPLVLQMPILFALYSLFTASIQLRHEGFMLWITDLSAPDVLISLPFMVPLLGNHISGLTVAMGVTMYFQQKQTITDPTQKAMVWMMPIMMTIMFNHFPSGLNLYYFVFNILSIGQQWYFNQRHKEEPLQKVQKKRKPGLMERLAQNMPKPPKK